MTTEEMIKRLAALTGAGGTVSQSSSGSSGHAGHVGCTGATGMGATNGYTHNNYYRQYSPEEMVEAFMAGWEKNDLLDERPIDEIAKEYLKNKFG